ncbi:hypothetical protein [Candidatus Magnetomonas plexicatena]|uniref:hypothetical protein n=1 Tax=Candidatus Magnetomonas plexicatena TaxID=2552947 RepID=UPI001C756A2F|nr:hypothetical protein E2O03_013815 [Nitrospirales bacterium LBB_01]
MYSIRDSVLTMIRDMPDDTTLEDIMESLYVKQKILKGKEQLDSGQFYTHEEANELMGKWLK